MSIKLNIFILLLTVATELHGAQSIYLQSWSTHYVKYNGSGSSDKFNEEHSTLAYKRGSYSVGTFVNSYNNRSYFIGYSMDLAPNWTLGAMLVHGYNRTLLPVPMLGYTIPSSFTIGKVRPELEINLIPAAITYSLKVTLD